MNFLMDGILYEERNVTTIKVDMIREGCYSLVSNLLTVMIQVMISKVREIGAEKEHFIQTMVAWAGNIVVAN